MQENFSRIQAASPLYWPGVSTAGACNQCQTARQITIVTNAAMMTSARLTPAGRFVEIPEGIYLGLEIAENVQNGQLSDLNIFRQTLQNSTP